MKMLMAVVRTTCLENIVKELARIGIRNVTVSDVRGIGEEVTLNTYAIHNLIQIIVPDEKVIEIENMILRAARSGLAGDGIFAVCPIDYMVKIRTKEKFE